MEPKLPIETRKTEVVQKPSVGRIVHFHGGPDAKPEAAIVTYVWSPTKVNLAIFSPGGGSHRGVKSVDVLEDGKAGAGWTWPPRS